MGERGNLRYSPAKEPLDDADRARADATDVGKVAEIQLGERKRSTLILCGGPSEELDEVAAGAVAVSRHRDGY